MSFMNEILKQNIPIWDACAATPFIKELQEGTLPFAVFKIYMIQDSIYLKHYARVFGKAIYLSETLCDIQFYYSVLQFVTDTESAVRLSYLNQFGLRDEDIEDQKPLPENQAYIDFLIQVADRGSIHELLMAILPCMLSYSYIFRKISKQPHTKDSRYFDFISDYAEDIYDEDCKKWLQFAEEKCKHLSPEAQKCSAAVFLKASELELAFWKMPYRAVNKMD